MTTLNIDLRAATQEALAEITRQYEVIGLAVGIADEVARSDIECACPGDGSVGRHFTFDTSKINEGDNELVRRALRYMELRGDALPYKVHRDGALIWFEDKP